MAYDVNYDDLDYGDETRHRGDYVGLPHDEANDGIEEGAAVGFDGTKIVPADDANPAIGVLYTYQYAGNEVVQDRNATVKVGGTVKAQVAGTVSAGAHLGAADTSSGETPGNFSATLGDATSNFVALSDARAQDGKNYAEVLLR